MQELPDIVLPEDPVAQSSRSRKIDANNTGKGLWLPVFVAVILSAAISLAVTLAGRDIFISRCNTGVITVMMRKRRALLAMVGLAIAAALPVSAWGQRLSPAVNAPVVFTPSKSVESLLNKYSHVHAKPNQYWQLTEEEWSRYEHIKKTSPWANWRNNASPLAVLAHYAPTLGKL